MSFGGSLSSRMRISSPGDRVGVVDNCIIWIMSTNFGDSNQIYCYESREGEDPELGLRDLAALCSKTFAIPSYPFSPHNAVELRYTKLCYGIRYDTL